MTNLEMTRGDANGIPVLRLRGRLTLGEGSRALRALITDLAAEDIKICCWIWARCPIWTVPGWERWCRGITR